MDTFLKETMTNDNETVSNYETCLKNYFGASYCLAVSSGTAAIIVALKAVGLITKHEVIAPPTAPLCTAYPIISTGATLKFCDVNPNSFGLHLPTLNRLISKNTGAIVEVPMWGYCTNVDELGAISRKHNIPLILDLAHCAGTKLKGKPLSDYCDIACFSTQKNKIFSTGEGGFILTNNEHYYHRALMYSRMGELNGSDFGLNFKISHYQAAAGILALENLDENLRQRRKNSLIITSGINHPNIEEFHIFSSSEPSYQRLLIKTKNSAGALSRYMVSRGVPSDIQKYNVKPLYEYPILKKYKATCPNAENLLAACTTIPVHLDYHKDQLNNIIDSINGF